MYGANVLVVGGAGFVGSNLCKKLLESDINSLIIVDNFLSSVSESLPMDQRTKFLLGSIADDKVLKQVGSKIDFVFHLATYHGNQSSIINPIDDHANNTFTTLKLCEHFKNNRNLKKLVYSSAGCTVAKKEYGFVEASDEVDEVSLYHDSPYQISKIIGEFYGNYYYKRHGLPFVKARFQNVYGPGEILGAGEWRGSSASVWRNVIPTFIWKSIHNESLPVENNGLASRDFIYVEDVVEGLVRCATKGTVGEVYNIASGVETTIDQLATIINKVTKNSKEVNYTNARTWDRSGNRFGSTEKTKKEIGFKASSLLEDGITNTVLWTYENKSLIRKNMLRHIKHLPDLKKYSL